MKFLQFLIGGLLIAVISLCVYLTVYQFRHVDMTPARVFVNNIVVVIAIMAIVLMLPYVDKKIKK